MTVYLYGFEDLPMLRYVCSLFFPFCKVNYPTTWEEHEDGLIGELIYNNEEEIATVALMGENGERVTASSKQFSIYEGMNKKQLAACQALYIALCKLTGKKMPWGMLIGVRPIKLLKNLSRGEGFHIGGRRLGEIYMVSEEKINLSEKIADIQQPFISSIKERDFALYISIPFCKSRCSYCSFISPNMDKAAALIPKYLEQLKQEIAHTAKISKQFDMKLRIIYIGGGTPAILTEQQIEKLLNFIENSFDMSTVEEFTFEGGRAEQLTEPKLKALKKHSITRLCINPQTMRSNTLHAIGRGHTAQDVIDCIKKARELGFDNINCDLIAGFEGENSGDIKYALNELLKYQPENITIHTLTHKRGTDITMESGSKAWNEDITEEMVEEGRELLISRGYVPYYLYRQKNMTGNLENIGYCRDGKIGLYNIAVMEDEMTLLACGGGAGTKLVYHDGSKIIRHFNYKYPYEYVEGFDNIMKRRQTFFDIELTGMFNN